ncbi:MAG TPA: DUF4209 domain-containing protein [Xanthobacteraceae bacterium]|nr:DUF4209 domain-containing protein [Xanthobacteraceae bacterium]
MTAEPSDIQPARDQEPEDKPTSQYTLASVPDICEIDFEAPVATSQSASSEELSRLLRNGPNLTSGANDDLAHTAAGRVFSMLAAITGMSFKPQEPNDPFGPAMVMGGRRSAIPSDFRGPPVETIAAMARRTKSPVIRARLADVCWLLERKRSDCGTIAIAAYVEIVKQVDVGTLRFHDGDEPGALKYDARDLLRRALSIGRGMRLNDTAMSEARQMVTTLRTRSFEERQPIEALWFGHLDLEFGVSDPDRVGKDVEALIAALPTATDGQMVVNLWRMAARAYRLAKNNNESHRAHRQASDQLVRMAEKQPMALLGAGLFTEAISELHGVPNTKDRRRELRHRLVDVQASIADEMSPFLHTTNVEDIVKKIQQHMERPTLRERLFVFAWLSHSPDPDQLVKDAVKSIQDHPLSSLVTATMHDREGKVVHRSEGANFGDSENQSAIERQIAEHERIRRNFAATAQIDVARQSIAATHYLSDDTFAHILQYSAFAPTELVMTYSHGLARFFQGDFVGALYILTPLLESSLRHVLKSYGHDVTKFDDATLTQEDRTISGLFDQMRGEMDSIFGRALTTDIENVFLKKIGPNIRNAVAHGLLHDGSPYGPDSLYASWLIFRMCLLPLSGIWDQLQLPFDDAEGAQITA